MAHPFDCRTLTGILLNANSPSISYSEIVEEPKMQCSSYSHQIETKEPNAEL